MRRPSLYYNWLDIRAPGLIAAPRMVEAFGTREARDQSAGPINEHYAFIPISAFMLVVGGYPDCELAIGHHLGQRMFDEVAATILSRAMLGGETYYPISTVVIARVRYRRTETGWRGSPVWRTALNLASEITMTEKWLDWVMPARPS